MTFRISTAARNAGLSAILSLLDAGSGPGKIRIYTGSQPAGGPSATATGTLLVEIPLNDPAFDAPSTGSAGPDVSPAVTANAVASGTAGWWRGLDSANTAVIDGAIGTELVLTNTAVTSGTPVTLTGGTITQPAS